MSRVTLIYRNANFQVCIPNASYCLACVVVTLKKLRDTVIDKED